MLEVLGDRKKSYVCKAERYFCEKFCLSVFSRLFSNQIKREGICYIDGSNSSSSRMLYSSSSSLLGWIVISLSRLTGLQLNSENAGNRNDVTRELTGNDHHQTLKTLIVTNIIFFLNSQI